MKTSKIILFSYIGLLATAFLVFVIYLSAAENNREPSDSRRKRIEDELPSFKYIDVKDQMTHILGSDRSYISSAVIETSDVSELNVKVVNDTLYIVPLEGTNNITLHLNDISSFTVINRNSWVTIKGINADTLNYIGFENSRLNGLNESEIGTFNAKVKGAEIQAYNGTINNINLTAEKSNLNFTTKNGVVNAKIRDNSKANFKSCNEMNIDKDDNSSVNVY